MPENPSKLRTVGIVLFPDAEELDFVGPFEVFTMADEVWRLVGNPDPIYRVVLISEDGATVHARKGMRIEADYSFADAPDLDVMLVPGGQGTRTELDNPAMLAYLKKAAVGCEWVTSVCTGSQLLASAGPAAGKRVTTHWGYVDTLRERGEAGEVLENIRYVRDGNVVTSAGVSAGIDMSLWLVGQMQGEDHARLTQRAMEYDPAPPYAAAV